MGSFVLSHAGRTATLEDAADAPRIACAALARNVRWFINIRWCITGILICFAATATYLPDWLLALGFIPPIVWPWVVATVLALANICFWLLSRRLDETSAPMAIEINLWVQIAVDLAAVTTLVHFVGSTCTFIPFLYLLHIVCACIFFPPKRSFLVASIASLLYAICVSLEHHGIWDQCTMIPAVDPEMHVQPWLPPIFAASAIVIWFGVWYLVQTLARAVVRRDIQLQRANQQLLIADEEKNKLVLRTTHDLKAPFSGIESNIQILRLQCGGELSPRALEILGRIESRSHSLAVRIRDILLLGRIRSQLAPAVEKQTFNIADLIRDVVSELEDKAKERGVRIVQKLLPLDVLGHATHYSILFLNLISNAVTYAYEGGTVTVSMRKANAEYHVSIADEGIGIAEDALPHIFDEYYRTSDAASFNPRSTGLGLSIVQELARKEGLGISVTSEKGSGSEFTVAIPEDYCSLKKTPYNDDALKGTLKTQRRLRMSRLVIVDDDVELANNLTAQLESRGHTVDQFHTMDGTLEKIAKNPPELAILDVMFPDNPAAGFDLSRALRQNEKTKDLPIILLTGVNQHFPMDFSSKDIDPDWMPVQGFMEKPVDLDALCEKITAMLKK